MVLADTLPGQYGNEITEKLHRFTMSGKAVETGPSHQHYLRQQEHRHHHHHYTIIVSSSVRFPNPGKCLVPVPKKASVVILGDE